MTEAYIVAAARTAIGAARKGTLADTEAEDLATVVLQEVVRRSGLAPERVDDVIFAESLYGGGVVARYAAVRAGMLSVSGQAVNRHCAGSLTSVGAGAAQIMSGMEQVIVAGGVQSSSTAPKMIRRVPGTESEFVENWGPPSHPNTAEAPNRDMSITVGWNTARLAGVSREEMDAWAVRSHQRAIDAIDAGRFVAEIVPVQAKRKDGSIVTFQVDEYPRRGSTIEKLASLNVLHPEIEGFSITAGNASGVNDAATAVMLANADFAQGEGLTRLAKVRAWAAVGVDPVRTGLAPIDAIAKVLARAGVKQSDIALWEINEAFASVPIAACKALGLDEETVNISGSGCSLGHPIAATGARMLITMIHDLQRRGGGLGVATMCAGGGMGGAVLIEV
jgi:acetyl-CoA acetyltransferase family protein